MSDVKDLSNTDLYFFLTTLNINVTAEKLNCIVYAYRYTVRLHKLEGLCCTWCNVSISVGDIFTIQHTACLDCIGVASRSLFDLKGLFDSGIYIIL